jgi:hypothetical protein
VLAVLAVPEVISVEIQYFTQLHPWVADLQVQADLGVELFGMALALLELLTKEDPVVTDQAKQEVAVPEAEAVR